MVVQSVDLGAEVKHIDLQRLTLPLYDQDTESADGLPKNAKVLKVQNTVHCTCEWHR